MDMMLLRELEGENCELEMVAGGCDKDCYRRRFKTKLIAMGMCGYDRVLIEPSGIFDVLSLLHQITGIFFYKCGLTRAKKARDQIYFYHCLFSLSFLNI